MSTDTIREHFFIAMLWASTDDDGEPMDKRFDLSDIIDDTKQDAAELIELFLAEAQPILDTIDMTDDHIGHNLFLTINGHGTGFWDRGLGEAGDKLTEICRRLGPFEAYETDVHTIHAMWSRP